MPFVINLGDFLFHFLFTKLQNELDSQEFLNVISGLRPQPGDGRGLLGVNNVR